MKRNLKYGVMASIVAIGVLGTTAVWAANSGGHIVSVYVWDIYVGVKAQGNNVYVDSLPGSDVMQIFGSTGSEWSGNASSNSLTISGGKFNNLMDVAGGYSWDKIAKNNTLNITGGEFVNDSLPLDVGGGFASGGDVTGNKVNISGGNINNALIYGGNIYGDDDSPTSGTISNNAVTISGNAVLEEASIYGGYMYGDNEINGTISNNVITISGKATLKEVELFGGDSFSFDDNSATTNNKVVMQNNKLVIDNWSGSALKAENFDSIDFKNMQWKNCGTILTLTEVNDKSLKNTKINLLSLAGGAKPAVNQSMYIIKGESFGSPTDLGIKEDNVYVSKDFSAGVALVGSGTVSVESDGSALKYTIHSLMQNSQTHLVAQNHAVAAAFVNQGTDLISDSLDTLSRDDKYGIKTFAAVHGNHSKYDVNSDLKINGWSGIVGVGSEKDIGNGDFGWGVFFENGSGTYRTYNSFNGDFFRGDGNVVYNGGGIAARFEQDNGVYTEGSLRAGLLKNEMKDALRDGAGSSYGYKSESTYYGAHIGVGKVIRLDAAKDLDIYGKFFHTYTDGDTFTVAGDKFELDSITSDRLRIGARLTTNKENKLSTYYGLAYEYEFNGDADMRVENMSTPQQSLKGSSYMAEIGMNYQPSSDSPWSFDVSMRGYTGQREGFSGNVQAVYSF